MTEDTYIYPTSREMKISVLKLIADIAKFLYYVESGMKIRFLLENINKIQVYTSNLSRVFGIFFTKKEAETINDGIASILEILENTTETTSIDSPLQGDNKSEIIHVLAEVIGTLGGKYEILENMELLYRGPIAPIRRVSLESIQTLRSTKLKVVKEDIYNRYREAIEKFEIQFYDMGRLKDRINPRVDAVILGRKEFVNKLAVRHLRREDFLPLIKEMSINYPFIDDVIEKYTQEIKVVDMITPVNVSRAQLFITIEPVDGKIQGTIVNIGCEEVRAIIDGERQIMLKARPEKSWSSFSSTNFEQTATLWIMGTYGEIRLNLGV